LNSSTNRTLQTLGVMWIIPRCRSILQGQSGSLPRVQSECIACRFGFELFAQLADEDAQVLRLMGRLRSPDGGEQGAMGHDLAGVTRKVDEQFELLGVRWMGLPLTVMMWAVASTMKSPASMAAVARSGARRRWRGPGQQLLIPMAWSRNRRRRRQRLRLWSAHGRGPRAPGWRGGAGANGAGDFNAGESRHHEIGDDEVGRPIAEDLQTFFGVVGGAHVVACAESAARSTRVICGSSSITRILPGMYVLLSWPLPS